MNVAERLQGAVRRAAPTVGLELGDLLAIAAFVVMGEISHGIDPVAEPTVVADTFVPFLIAWLFVSIPAGVYSLSSDASPRAVALRTLGTWFAAVVLALSIRRTVFFRGGTTPLSEYATFGLVALAVGGVLLVAWRVALSVLRRRRRTPAPA